MHLEDRYRSLVAGDGVRVRAVLAPGSFEYRNARVLHLSRASSAGRLQLVDDRGALFELGEASGTLLRCVELRAFDATKADAVWPSRDGRYILWTQRQKSGSPECLLFDAQADRVARVFSATRAKLAPYGIGPGAVLRAFSMANGSLALTFSHPAQPSLEALLFATPRRLQARAQLALCGDQPLAFDPKSSSFFGVDGRGGTLVAWSLEDERGRERWRVPQPSAVLRTLQCAEHADLLLALYVTPGAAMPALLEARERATGALRWRRSLEFAAEQLLESHDGQRLWCVGKCAEELVLADGRSSGSQPLAFAVRAGDPATISHDGQSLFVAVGPRLRVLSTASGDERPLGTPRLGHLRDAWLAPGGAQFAVVNEERGLEVYSGETGALRWQLTGPIEPSERWHLVVFSPDQRHLLALVNEQLRRWDLSTGLEAAALNVPLTPPVNKKPAFTEYEVFCTCSWETYRLHVVVVPGVPPGATRRFEVIAIDLAYERVLWRTSPPSGGSFERARYHEETSTLLVRVKGGYGFSNNVEVLYLDGATGAPAERYRRERDSEDLYWLGRYLERETLVRPLPPVRGEREWSSLRRRQPTEELWTHAPSPQPEGVARRPAGAAETGYAQRNEGLEDPGYGWFRMGASERGELLLWELERDEKSTAPRVFAGLRLADEFDTVRMATVEASFRYVLVVTHRGAVVSLEVRPPRRPLGAASAPPSGR